MMTRRILPDEAERLLTGRVPAADDLMELHMALSAVRTRYEAAPDPGVRAGHLAAMQVAFASKGPAPAPAKRRGRMTRRASIAVAGLVLAGGSALAATGFLSAVLPNEMFMCGRCLRPNKIARSLTLGIKPSFGGHLVDR